MAQTMPKGVHYTIQGQWTNGRPVYSSWYAQVLNVNGRDSAVQESAVRLVDKWFTHVLPVLPDNYSFSTVAWTDLDSAGGATGTASRASANGGDVSAAGTPPNQGVLVRKNIAGSGRSKRAGRIFLPGNLETLVDENGIVSSGKLTQVTTALEAFRTNFKTTATVGLIGGCWLVVAHAPSVAQVVTKTIKAPDPDGVLSWDEITSFSGQTIVSGIKARVGR